jgi:acetylornithine deacetylase
MFLGKAPEALLKDLIKIPSYGKKDESIIKYLKHLFDKVGWTNFEITINEVSSGILVTFGIPKVLFTSHVDVVDGPLSMFDPIEKNGIIHGRGAVDAKGSVVSMICACQKLLSEGYRDFGLFLFGGEECGGKGASACMSYLQGFGIKYVIMGEPTKCKLARSQLGALCLDVKFHGLSVLSAFPNDGVDANRFLVRAAEKLYSLDESVCSLNGIWSVNLGKLYGGLSANTISPFAAMEIYIRTSENNHEDVISVVKSFAPESEIEILFSSPKRDLFVLEGYESIQAIISSGLHHFEALEDVTLMMAGPGDPRLAHHNDEQIEISQLYKAIDLYCSIFNDLKMRPNLTIPSLNKTDDHINGYCDSSLYLNGDKELKIFWS